jgi:hypothetical protein
MIPPSARPSRAAAPSAAVAPRDVEFRAIRSIGRGGLAGLAAVLVVGCSGGDSVTNPGTPPTPPLPTVGMCANEPGCRTSTDTPIDPLVFAAVADARERLVPMIDDAAARIALDRSLGALELALQANGTATARGHLADVYAQLDRLRIEVEGFGRVDLPDAASIRLGLVPVANALGVSAP